MSLNFSGILFRLKPNPSMNSKYKTMKLKKPLSTKCYQHIGYLFYAMAAADEQVVRAEIDTLKQLAKRDWLPIDDTNDRYGSDAAYQIEIVFDWLQIDSKKSANDCYRLFERYYLAHQSLFSPELKQLILRTAEAIANSFAKKNKSELMLLAKLSILFKDS